MLASSGSDTLPNFIRFIAGTMSFYLDTSLIFSTRQYIMTLQGSLPSGISSLTSFNLYVVGCESAVVTAPTVSNKVYNVGD